MQKDQANDSNGQSTDIINCDVLNYLDKYSGEKANGNQKLGYRKINGHDQHQSSSDDDFSFTESITSSLSSSDVSAEEDAAGNQMEKEEVFVSASSQDDGANH